MTRLRNLTLLCCMLTWNSIQAETAGEVRVVISPSPIPEGTGQGAHDITLINSKMAVAFAVNTTPPWGVPRGGIIDIDVDSSEVQVIFGEARRIGADVVQINHPYMAYGYFHSDEQGGVRGGYSNAFDLVEITAADLAVNGLRRVTLVERGLHMQTQDFANVAELTDVMFKVQPGENTWYSLLAEDALVKFLLSNPVWVKSSVTPESTVDVSPKGNPH
ncbi:MAG: hypothetical protein SH820_09775 [Xanthomonadales bacterium]|nr:hypothetical protein [Xanthomonadales bacterium]